MRPYCIQGYLRVTLAAPCNGNPDDSRCVLLELENISDLPLTDVALCPHIHEGYAETVRVPNLQPGEKALQRVRFLPGNGYSRPLETPADPKERLSVLPCEGSYSLNLEMPEGMYTLTLEASCVRPITQRDLQDAVVQTAWAYYFKQHRVQYDSAILTAMRDKNCCVYRNTEGMPPEYATDHTTHFSVCTYFCFDSYFSTFGGYRIGGGKNAAYARTHQLWKHIPMTDSTVVLRWSSLPGEAFAHVPQTVTNGAELADWLAENERWRALLQPGDVIINSGHATMYVGEGMILECWGSKYNASTGTELYEKTGAIMLNSFVGYYLDPKSSTGFNFLNGSTYNGTKVLILRPTNHMVDASGIWDPECGYGISGGSLGRLRYPGLETDRTVDRTPYGTACAEGMITYRLRITNNSSNRLRNINKSDTLPDGTKTDFPNWWSMHWNEVDYAGETYRGLPVVEKLPQGTTLVSGSASDGAQICNDGTICWLLDLTPGESVTLQYAVSVGLHRGETVVSGDSFVGGIPSNTITSRVGGEPLSDVALARIGAYQSFFGQYTPILREKGVANGIYESVFGLKLNLPDRKTLVETLFVRKTVEAGLEPPKEMLLRATDCDDPVRTMLVDRFFGGYLVHSEQLKNQRIWDLDLRYYAVGDILVKVYDIETGDGQTLVYLGDGCFATLDEDDEAVAACAMGIWQDIFKAAYQAFFLLRPSQAYSDLNSQLEGATPFVPDPAAAEEEERLPAPGDLVAWRAAVVETALAYYRKRAWSVFGNEPLTRLGLAGPLRATWNVSPEAIEADKPYFGISEYLIYEIFQNALGLKLAKDQNGMLDTAGLLKQYGDAVLPVQVADILLLKNGGMALYLGDNRYLTMTDVREPIVILDKVDAAGILRPLTSECGARLTNTGAARLACPGLEIRLTSSLSGRYATAREGETVTYTLTVTNHGPDPYRDLELIQLLPRKGIYADTPDSRADGGAPCSYSPENHAVKWVTELGPGETVRVCSRITCKKNLVNVGMQYLYYLAAGAMVGKAGTYLKAEPVRNRIGLKKPDEAMLTVLSELTNETLHTIPTGFQKKKGAHGVRHIFRCMGVGFAEGIHKSLPGISTIIGIKQKKPAAIALEMDQEKPGYDLGVLKSVDDPGGFVRGRQMLVEGFYGGSLIWADQTCSDLVLDPSLEVLEPGDIIMAYFGKTAGSSLVARNWVYLGTDRETGKYRLVCCDPTEKNALPNIREYAEPRAFFAEHNMARGYDADTPGSSCCAAFMAVRMSQVENILPGPEEPDRFE